MKIFILIFLTSLQLPIFGKVRHYSFNEQCRKATEIFTGRVIKLDIIRESNSEYGYFKTYKITFVTNKVWKGSVYDTITCIAGEGICSPFNFELGNNYLVYSDSGKITLGSGRSGDIQFSFVKSDMRRLSIRYLFRRPAKLTIDNRLTAILNKRQPITAVLPQGGQTTRASA